MNKQYVSIYSSPIRFPFTMTGGVHTWIVVGLTDGTTHRYDLHHFSKNGSYLFIDYQPLSEGIPIFSRCIPRFFPSKCLYTTTSASAVTEVINAIRHYPYKDTYCFYPGPNCNSFVQRVINQSPSINYILPKTAYRKSYV